MLFHAIGYFCAVRYPAAVSDEQLRVNRHGGDPMRGGGVEEGI